MPTERRVARVFEVLARRQRDLTVLAEDVYKPHNLSAMLRTCDAVGVGTVHAVRPTGGVPTYDATSASADKWTELVVHRTIDEAVDRLRGDGMQIVAAHFSDQARDYGEVDYLRPTAVLFGNERSGVSARAAALADVHVVIPMLGMVRSLNVSVATAVILFEAQRQRRAAGMYDVPALSARERNALAVRWLYPDVAERALQAGRELPWLDEHGRIVDASGPEATGADEPRPEATGPDATATVRTDSDAGPPQD